MVLAGCSNKHQQSSGYERPQIQQSASATPAAPPAVPPVQPPHEKTSEEIWNEATPATRRSILANSVRRKWKNVRVEDSGAIMTITHPGMDEQGAHQIIDDVGKLAAAAGLKRINLVRDGGMCQYEVTRPYCEVAGQIPGNSETGGTGCGPCCDGRNGWTHPVYRTYSAPCQPYTWVYNVP